MKKPGLNKSARQSPLNEKPFEVELIIGRILFGFPNDAAELKGLSFVTDLFSFAGMPAEITSMGCLNMQPAKRELPRRRLADAAPLGTKNPQRTPASRPSPLFWGPLAPCPRFGPCPPHPPSFPDPPLRGFSQAEPCLIRVVYYGGALKGRPRSPRAREKRGGDICTPV